jgi:hypothetical protein
MSDYQFWEELCAFTILCIIFVFLKAYICCSSLGLGQNHKQAAVRSGLDAKTSLNCKETSKIILRANQKIALISTYVEGNDCLVGNSVDLIPLKQVRFHKHSAQIHGVQADAELAV